MSPRSKPYALIGLAIAFGWLPLLSLTGFLTRGIADVNSDIRDICAKWLVVAVLCVIAFAGEQLSPRELGIRPLGWRDALLAVAGAILALFLSGAASRLVTIPASLDLHRVAAIPLGVRIALVLTAAFCEEFIYRAFAIEGIALLTRSRWLAGLLSAVFFTLSHAGLYGLSPALILPGMVAAVLTLLYLWRRNLAGCVLMHATVDGLLIVVLPLLV